MGYWSYVLAAIGITGIWLAGRNDPRGWLLGVCAQVVWMAYALNTEQYGFCLTALGYGYFQGKNYLKWKRSLDQQTPVAVEPTQVPANGRCPCEEATYCLASEDFGSVLTVHNLRDNTCYVLEKCPLRQGDE